MATPARKLGAPADPQLDGSATLEGRVQAPATTGADEVGRAAVPVEIDEGYDEPEPEARNWRRDYADSVGMPLYEKVR